MNWKDKVKIEENKVRRNRILEGPKTANCWWLKGKKKGKK